MWNRLGRAFVAILVAGIFGCGGRMPTPPVSAGEPLGLQMLRTESQLQKYPFFTLLSFERDTDPVFVVAEGTRPTLSATQRHTGDRSLELPAGLKTFGIRLDSLHSGRQWPGPWALLGAYFYAASPQRLTAAYELEGVTLAEYTVELPAGQWTPVLLDIAAALEGRGATAIGTLRFGFGEGLPAAIWCDDVLEMDNTTVIVDAASPLAGSARFRVVERGFQYTIEHTGFFTVKLKTPEASDRGWRLEEANALRTRFSSRGTNKHQVIYASGTRITDGVCTSLVRPSQLTPLLEQQHANPANISITAETGRLNRNSPLDANNDGYAESTGTYQVIAAGPRLELRISPRAAPLLNPVLEVEGLPPGAVLGNMDGRLLERICRLDDGRVLVELPGTLSRAATVNLRAGQ